MAIRSMKTWEAALWLVTGAAAGAGAALLLAPRSGKETRREIARIATKAGRGVEGIVEEFSETVAGMVDAVGKEAAGVLERGRHAAAEAKKDLIKTIDEAQGALEKQRAKLSKLVA